RLRVPRASWAAGGALSSGAVADVAELVDARRSGRRGRKVVGVRVPPSAWRSARSALRDSCAGRASIREGVGAFVSSAHAAIPDSGIQPPAYLTIKRSDGLA